MDKDKNLLWNFSVTEIASFQFKQANRKKAKITEQFFQK